MCGLFDADALSRCPADKSCISAVVEETTEDEGLCLPELEGVRESQLEDTDTAAMLAYLQDGDL